jgi:beta-aspartyl-peptidase (threonine type)
MDASIMIGATLNSGAVTVVKDIAHPITLARRVMEKTPHFLLAGEGANRFAKEQGVAPCCTSFQIWRYSYPHTE